MAKSIFQVNPVDAAVQEAGVPDIEMSPPELPAIEQPAPTPQPVTASRRPAGRGLTPAKPSASLMGMFEQASAKYGVPLNVLMALGEQESRYNPMAIGVPTQWGRAQGLMQYLPSTAAGMGINPFDPAQSIDAAAKQLSERLRRGYSMRDAVMEHHGGPNRRQWGAKTARYGEEVLERARRLRGDLAPTHGNWYSPGAAVDDGPSSPIDARAVAGVTGASVRKPAPSIGIAESIADPSSRPELLARYAGEQTRKRDEGGMSATQQPRPSVRSVLGGLATSTSEAFEQARQGIRMQAEDLAGDAIDAMLPNAPGLSLAEQREQYGVTNAERAFARSQDRAAASTPAFDSWWAEAAYGGLQSLAQTAPGIAAGIVGGAPLGLAILGGQTEAQAYGKYRARGATPGMALLGAVGEGGVEVATELLPMGYLTDKFGKAGLGDFLTGYFAREMPTEQVATFVQDAIDTAIANPDKTWGDFWAERADAAGKTAVATLMQSGAFAGLNSAVGRIARDDARQARAEIEAIAPSVEAADPGARAVQPHPSEDTGLRPADRVATPRTEEPTATGAEPAPRANEPTVPPMPIEPVPAAPPPPPAGPLARAMQGAPLPEPSLLTPEPTVAVPPSSDGAGTPMLLITPAGEMSVSIVGETPDALWVKGMSGEELQIPRAQIDAGMVQLLPQAEPAEPEPTISTTETVEPAATGKDGLQIEPASPTDIAAEPFASDAQKAENVKEVAPAPTSAEDALVATGSEAPAVKQSLAAAEEIVDPETGEILASPAPAALPSKRPADPSSDLSALDEPALRERLRTLASNARNSGGWDKAKLTERKRLQTAIDRLSAEKAMPDTMSSEASTPPMPLTPATIAQAEAEAATSPLNDLPEPTKAQKEAGNYKKGHVVIGGLDVSIENPAGTSRRPEWPPLKHSYGYVKRSEGADGDHVDVFLGPKAADPANPVFIVDQVNKDGNFDEHKVMVGFADAGAARRGYLANYAKGWSGLGAITEMPFEQFKTWVRDPANTTKPAMPVVTAANPADVAPLASPAPADARQPAAATMRPTDKKNPNPYVRAGERYHFAEQVEYLGGDPTDVYVVERAGKKDAYFRNEGSGGGSYLQNYQMQAALRKGALVAVDKSKPDQKQNRQISEVSELETSASRPIDQKGKRETARPAPSPAAPRVPEERDDIKPDVSTQGSFQPGPEKAKPDAFAGNKLFTADKVEAARARLKEKMNRINSGVDPEVLIDGMTIAGAYIEAGVRKFADYAAAMRADFGERITPYLLSFWEGARNYPGLDTTGMSSPEESRSLHGHILRIGLPGEEAVALGTEVAAPKAKKQAKQPSGARVLRDDWGVDHINGRTPIPGGKNEETDEGLKGGLKDAFLADSVAYLRAVAAALKPLGFAPHEIKGKPANPVSRDVGGPAVGGGASLVMRHESGANIHAMVSASSAMRGAVPTTKSGVSLLYRVSTKEGDKYATSGVNRWTPVDLSAIDLADTIAWEVTRGKPELTRDVPKPEPARPGGDRGGVSPDEGGRRGGNVSAARPDIGELADGQPENVGESRSAGPDAEDGVRGAGKDVAPAGRADEGGNASDRRPRAGGARGTDAGAGSRTGELDLFDARPKVSPEPSPASGKKDIAASPARSGPGNFHIANPLEIVGGGPVARFDRNRAAIETYNAIREDGRPATAEEQRILAGYTGWGSFGQELFQGSWARPQPKDAWVERDRWLRDHMGQAEWESAQRSITNAHYTDPPTVMAMWAMMQRMGFAGGRILEPSMGIGNFFGMMPAEIAGRSQLAGIELDSLTGGMAQLLYPDANVRVMGYQDSRTPDGFYDLVIGNWPFENTVIADRRYDRLSPFLHDYFFLKALDQVRTGGIVMGITSSGTMDKKATGIRRELAKNAELVAAFRLPSGAFAEYAGTKVVTDIVILRKRAEPIALADKEGWVNAVPYQTPNGEVTLNEYYVANPTHVIGRIDFGHGTTRGQPGLIVHRPDDMQAQIQRIIEAVPADTYVAEQRAKHVSYVANHTADREGSLTRTDAGLFVVRGEHLAPAEEVRTYAVKDASATAARRDQLERLVDMRQRYAALIEADRTGDGKAARTALNTAYAGFVDKHGPLTDSFGLSYLRKIDDPFYPALAALEIDGRPAAILSRSTTRAAATIEQPTIADAFVLERNVEVNPSLDAIAARAGVSRDAAKADLIASGAVFELPSGDVVPSDMYLSGNVREKLRQAKAAVEEGMTHLQRNVDALAAVVPPDVPYFKIETQLGATWIAPDIYAEFVGHMLGMPDGKGVEVRYNAGRWSVRIDDRLKARPEASNGFGTGEYSFQRLVNAAFGNQSVTIRRTDSKGTSYVDRAATEEVNGKLSEMRTKFGDWLWSDPERRVAVEAEYNEVRNAFATPKFDGSFLRFEGMALSLGNGPFDLRQHQADAIWRALVSRRSLNAHEVGTGKTFTMGGIAVESRRYGIARKPLILAHNANSKTVAAEIQQMYPAAKILYIDNLSPATIDVKMRQIANDDWDAVVVPHSLIDRFSFREDTLMAMAREDIAALEEEAHAAASDDGATIKDEMWDDPEELRKLRSPTAKELVKMRQRIIETIRKQSHRASREGAIAFEELGVDMLMVDEAHEFKKPPISTRMKMKGLNTQTSDRSIALSFMTRYIRSENAGGNVHLFTGTPITNTLTEVFHMMRYIMQEEMQAAGVDQWDGWFGSFAREVMDVEQNAAAEYEAVTRLAGFINVPELRRMIGQYMDVVFADDMPEMQPRRTKSGKTMADSLSEAERAELLNGRTEGAKDRPYKRVINVTSDLTPQQKVIFEQLRGYARRWRSMNGKERREAMAAGSPESPIITEGLAAKASFDVRLYDGESLAGQEGKTFDDEGSKASRVVANVKEIYDAHAQATQVIFAEQGMSNRVTRSLGKDDEGNRRTRTFPTFSTIRDIVERLVAAGIPREQIAIVDGGTSKDKRKEIALKMNAAKIRVVIGSTATLGVGVNMQKNLRAMHHMDAPWMPGDLEQRNGRGQRQGNQWNTVLEYRYLTDRLDGRRWQVLAIKQRFITAFLKADDSARTIEGEAAADEQSDILQSFAEAAGDPRILIREKLRKQLDGAQRRERLHMQGIANALSEARRLDREIGELREELDALDAAGTVERVGKLVSANAGNGFAVTVDGTTFDKRKDADDAIASWAAFNMRVGDAPRAIGTFGGHELMLGWPGIEPRAVLSMTIDGTRFSGGTMQGLEKSLRKLAPDVDRKRNQIAEKQASAARLRQVAKEPFHMAADLARYDKALDALELDIQVNPVPPPAWLRAGAPVDTEFFWNGAPFTVTGHRWNAEGWFVLADDARGVVSVPYMEVKDGQGINLYEERPFEAPELIEKPTGADAAERATEESADDVYSIGAPSGGGFQSVDGLRQHLTESRLGPAIERMLKAGKIHLHRTAETLPDAAGAAASATGKPVAVLSGRELVADDLLSLGRAAQKWYRKNLRGQRVTSSDGHEVRFARLGEGKIASGKGEDTLRAVPAIRAIIEKGRHSGPFTPSEKWAARGVIALHHYTGVVEIAGQTSAFGVSVHELSDGRRQYNITNRPDEDVAESRFSRAEGRPEGATRVEITPGDAINIVRMPLRDNSIQAMTAADGMVHLVSDRLTSRTAVPVLLHEIFHAGARPLLGNARWNALMKRMGALFRSAMLREVAGERGNGAYWRRALDRVEAAAPPPGQMVEEFAAYAIEERASAPAGVRDVVDRLLGAFKAWLLRGLGMQLGDVSPSQLQALAIAALRSGKTAARTTDAFSRTPPAIEQIDAVTPGLIHNLVTKAMDGRASLLGAVPLRPLLSEMAGNIPAAQDYLQLKQTMDTVRDQWHARADEVSQRWLKFRMLHRADNIKLMDLMHEATLAGVDPSIEFQSIITKADAQVLAQGGRHEAHEEVAAKQARDDIRRGDHGRLVAAYEALPDEGKRLFAFVRNSYTAMSRAFEQAMLDNLSRALDIRAAQAQRDFDAEMLRIAESKMSKDAAAAAVAAAEKQRAMAQQIAGWAKGARMTRLRHFFETNNLEGPYFPLARFGNFFVTVRDESDQVISFSRFEKPAEQQRFAADMRKEGYDVDIGVLDDGGDLRKQVDARFVADIEDILEGADVSDTVRDAVWQRWLESMPDMSIRTSRIHRKGRAGYSNDALRAYGHHMFHGAHQLARLKYSLQMDDAISQAREQSKRMPDPVRAGLIVNELARRNQFVMNPTGGPLAQMVTSAAFTYFLAVSPAAALVNTTQTAVLGVPILAAYDGRPGAGAARAAHELSRALRAFAGGKGHAGRSARLTPDEAKAMDAAYETGLIERTQSHDLAGVGETGVAYSPVRAKVMAAISWAFHHTERMNREVTFLAAYRMARKKGEPHGMAIERASELTWKIHFDYQNTSRPRIMQGDTAKVLFVFRNFNVNMLFRLFRDAHQAVKGGTQAERRVALTQLAGTTGMMMLSAGIRGTWLYGVAIALATLFFGDDAEDEFKRGMIDALGHRLGGMALNGVPGDLLGVDLSNRIGMPDLWFRSPDRELEGRTEFDYWAIQVLGAGVGGLRNMWAGASMIGDGHFERGIETMAPKFAKDLMRSGRYLSEGANTLQGDPIMEDMPVADAVKQALGFTPAALAERYARNQSMKNAEQRILDQRRAALHAFDQAQRAGEDTAEAEALIDAFNEENPDYPITVRSLRQSMRSREQMRERKQGGVYLNPKLRDRLNEEAPPLVYEAD